MPRIVLEPRFPVEYLSVLDSDGNLDTALEPKLAGEDLRALYRAMLLGPGSTSEWCACSARDASGPSPR